MRFSVPEFFMGRDQDSRYAFEMTTAMRHNAERTVDLVNTLAEEYMAQTGDVRPRHVNSGWRPAALNAITPGASKTSKHLTCEAIDIGDDGTLDAWLDTEEGAKAMADVGLWREHPKDTPTWCHLQIAPPRGWQSGMSRTFPR